ncbi:MAG: ribonuclease HI family protein [Actinomycetota bacterium]|nr:ribonuclease HI family protein [Actinomycetota bacterium]
MSDGGREKVSSSSEASSGEKRWLVVMSDGASSGNPGPAGIGGLALDEEGNVLAEVSRYLGRATNNVAEYHALIAILEQARELGFENLKILTDSELLTKQVIGGFKVKSKSLRPLVAKIKSLIEGYSEVLVQHVPRESNVACDRLARAAIRDGLAGKIKPVLDDEEETLFQEVVE